MTKKIRILLVEDNRLLQEGMLALFKKHPDLLVASMLGMSEAILKNIGSFNPDILLIDIGLRDQNSLHLVESVKASFPATKSILMDLIPTQQDVLQFVQAGVSGFIVKDATEKDFLKTIRSVAEGSKVLPSNMTGSLFSQVIEHAVNGSKVSAAVLKDAVRMTPRERQVIDLVSEGMTNKNIALELNMATLTVKRHIHNIMEKLALHTRLQIANYALTPEHEQLAPNSIS